jgi:hypothetical protein
LKPLRVLIKRLFSKKEKVNVNIEIEIPIKKPKKEFKMIYYEELI